MTEMKIVFTKSKKKMAIGSKAIMWWTKKPYSHVARETSYLDWGKSYYQASEGNVNYEHELIFNTKHEIVKEYILEIPDELAMEIKKACYQEAGGKYGSLQNLGIFLTDLYYKILQKHTKNPWRKGRNCSEIMYVKCFKKMKPELAYDENKIKPHNIEEIILNHFHKCEHGKWIMEESAC